MSTLIVANTRTEEMVGELASLTALGRQAGGSSALRMLWFARSGDVLVLPFRPRAEYLAYVTGLTGIDPGTLTVLIPPPGELGIELLTPDRTADRHFRRQVREAVRERGVDRVMAVYKDIAVTQFAAAIGLSVPGHAFSAQGGDALINSKAGFRALAAGTGTPIAPGLVTRRRTEAEQLVLELFAAGHSVMVKQEFHGGGLGNEILSPAAGIRVAGAPRAVVLPDASAVAGYFAMRWDWLTAGGRHRLVLEQYLTDCETVYAEYFIDDDGPRLSGTGDILMAPVAVGQIVPAQALTAATRSKLVESGLRLTTAVHAMGYRGYLSTDAVLTPTGEIFITETNGRLSGSTHLHAVLDERVLAPEFRGRRVLLERFGWTVPSFAAAVERLGSAGLDFAVETGVGVVLTSDLRPDRSVSFCVIAEDLESARTIERRLTVLLAEAEPDGVQLADHMRHADLSPR